MLSSSSTFNDIFEKDTVFRPVHKVEMEWNINRYANDVVVTNGTAVESDPDLFPLDSIVNPNRGLSGVRILKTGDVLSLAQTDEALGSAVHSLLANPYMKYKYWISSTKSSPTSPFAITGVNPQVMYDTAWAANNLRVVFEISTAKPSALTIETTSNGTTWTTVAVNPTIGTDGVLSLYHNGSAWTTNKSELVYTNLPNIRGIRVNVTRMNKGNSFCEVIEIGARRIADVSDRVKDFSVNMEANEVDIFKPIGAITANTLNLALDNSDGAFNPDNTSGPYNGLLGGGAVIRPYVGLDMESRGAGIELIQQGEYYTSPWGVDTGSLTVSISGKDAADLLQSDKLGPMLFVDKTVPQIIKSLCGAVGFNRLRFINTNKKSEFVIPFVFFEDGKTVWECLQSVITADQGSLFFDELGYLVYISREDAIAQTTPDYTIFGQNSGLAKPNIANLNQQWSYLVNKVDVNYKKYEARQSYNIPIDSILWEPEGDVTLRANPLTVSMNTTQTYFEITAADSVTWPYQGLVNINGEIMSYEGKEYKYLNTTGGTFLTGIVKTEKDKDVFDKVNPGLSFKNYFTGKFVNVKRKLYGTPALSHSASYQGYSFKRSNAAGVAGSGASQFQLFRPGILKISHPAVPPGEEFFRYAMWKIGSGVTHHKIYGVRFKFNAGSTQGIFGIQYNSGDGERQGLFAEVRLTSYCDSTKRRVKEVGAYRRTSAGTAEGRGAGVYGVETPIVKDRWYNLEVVYDYANRRHSVYLDGTLMTAWFESETWLTDGWYGFFVRGGTWVDIDHFYGASPPTIPLMETETLLDTLTGGYISDYVPSLPYRQWRTTSDWMTTGIVFDDMGSTVHELREFDVKYDKAPALTSKLYLSNSRVKIAEMTSTPFSSKFIIGNGWKDTVIVNGEDKTLFQSDESVDQKMMVYGQLIEKTDEQKVTVSDSVGLRRDGEEYLEFDSEWVQTEAQANSLANYVKTRWGKPSDVVSTTGYFNPSVQIGDLVAIHYPDKNMTTTSHRYLVLTKQIAYSDGGFKVTLTLARLMV